MHIRGLRESGLGELIGENMRKVRNCYGERILWVWRDITESLKGEEFSGVRTLKNMKELSGGRLWRWRPSRDIGI